MNQKDGVPLYAVPISNDLISALYSFGNLLTTFAGVAGRSVFPPWWMPIGVPSLTYSFGR